MSHLLVSVGLAVAVAVAAVPIPSVPVPVPGQVLSDKEIAKNGLKLRSLLKYKQKYLQTKALN